MKLEKGGNADVTAICSQVKKPKRRKRSKGSACPYLFILPKWQRDNQRSDAMSTIVTPEQTYFAKYANVQEGAATIRAGSLTSTGHGTQKRNLAKESLNETETFLQAA